MTWENLIILGWLALAFVQITLWIDPGWEDARKEVPLLGRIVRPLSGALGPWLWWAAWASLFIGTIVLVQSER